MDRILRWLVDPAGLTPHGFCLLWNPGILWTQALSDLSIGAAYFAISLTLAVIVRRRRDLSFRPLAWLFISFILLCGATHWLDVLTLWVPAYGAQAVTKVATAVVSVVTAIGLWRLVPAVLAQPSLAAFRKINEALRTNQEFLDRIGMIAGVGGWEYDIARSRMTWSAETYRIYGVAPDYEPTAANAIEFFAPEARSMLRAAFEKGVAEGEGWDLELPFDRQDGRRVWVRAMGKATLADGKPTRISGALQDVTDQRAARLALQRASERVALATDSGGIGIWEWDLETGALAWDAWMYRLYGMAPGDGAVPYELWAGRLHPDDRDATEQALRDANAGVKPYETEFRIIWSDDSVHHIRAGGHVERDASGRATRVVGANWDVTDARRLAADLAAEHQLLRVTLDSIGDGVITTDLESRVTWLNPVAERMTGWTAAEAASKPLSMVFQLTAGESGAPCESPAAACLAQGKIVAIAKNAVLVSRDGAEFGVQDSASPIRNGQGETLGAVVVFHDVTEQRRMSREMSHRASHDSVTGLANRAEFESRLGRSLDRARAGAGQAAVLYIDLDQFKVVNDSYGHAVGDQVLIHVANLMREAVRGSDMVARLGGDEFGIVLDDCPAARALVLAERVCERVGEFRFVHDDKRIRVGASIGLAPIDDRWTSVAAIQQAADSACYAAKEAGRNRVHVWRETDEVLLLRKRETQWATRLESALDQDRFKLYHQRIEPLVASTQGEYAEVLLRMQDTDGAILAPGAFLPAAERFQMASRIDRWVFSRVIRWMKATPVLERIGALSVNVSGQSVGDRSFHRWAAELLAEAGPEVCRKLCLEITETAAVTNLADAARFVEQVHEAGVRVALDDFGAGASSFGYLKALRVDILKIDGQYIRDLMTDPLDAATVRCFVEVAGLVGVKTVAESVDHPDLPPLLKRMGVDFAQGFLFHHPAPLDEFARTAAEA